VSNVRAGIGVGVLLGLALSALLILMATAPAQAETTGDCKDQFDKLQEDITYVHITSGKVDKERDGLLKLVNDAQVLVSDGKTSDAVKKLSDFTVKVDQLEAAGRISAESAVQLRSDAQATIACLQG
jgi:FIMAH domain